MNASEVLKRFGDLPFTLELELGSLVMTIGEIFDLKAGAILRTDHASGVPFALLADGVKLAEAEIVIVEEVVSARINKLWETKKAAPGDGSH
jgi:flagellar motor switch/type III secretory pathway protein FliN